MWIVEQISREKRLQVALFACKAGLDGAERPLKRGRRQRIAAVQPGRQATDHQVEPARKAARVVLAPAELHRIHGGLDGRGRNPACSEFAERVENERFDLVDILRIYALETGRER